MSTNITGRGVPLPTFLKGYVEDMPGLELMVTLCPSMPHFSRFARDSRLSGIRINSAMLSSFELENEFAMMATSGATVPLYFDIKGRQIRVVETLNTEDRFELILNHRISVDTRNEIVVLFKAENDSALLDRLEDDGKRLIFRTRPKYTVKPGESLHIRHSSFRVHGPILTDVELEKIAKVKTAGFTRYYLSYVEEERDVDQLLELVGKDAQVMLKIENKRGLEYVARSFRKRPNVSLVAARGDLYIEVDRPHHILRALRLIIEKDPEACVGSRILLSVAQPLLAEVKRALVHVSKIKPDATEAEKNAEVETVMAALMSPKVPACADFAELAWLYDIGYRKMLLCDELCLREDLLSLAVNAFDSFRQSYARG